MLQPLGVHVLVEAVQTESEFVTKPETTKGEPEEGVVVGIGEEVKSEVLKVGDRVVFRRYAPEPFEAGEKLYHLIEEQDLMGRYA